MELEFENQGLLWKFLDYGLISGTVEGLFARLWGFWNLGIYF
jgi:hypothetical protein